MKVSRGRVIMNQTVKHALKPKKIIVCIVVIAYIIKKDENQKERR